MSNDNGYDESEANVLEPGVQGSTREERKAMFKKGDYLKKPWDVQIDVILKPGFPDDPNAFDIHTSLPVDPAGNIEFKNNHRPGFNIDFILYDETGCNPPFKFPPQPHVREACWTKIGYECPTEQCYEVFEPRQVDVSGTILTVYNENPSPAIGDFQFALRVTNDYGASYWPVDPIGQDMNGPRK